MAQAPPRPPNEVVAQAEAQWLFSEAELANSPSIQDGLSQKEEGELRAKGVNFIVQVGILLKLPQLTLSTAAVFFQRFLMRASLKKPRNGIPKLHQYQAAATALFLATKVEESCRKMKELVQACCRIAQKNPDLVIDEQSKDFWRWRDCILDNEDVLLETLCFDLTVESPHRQLFEMLKYYKLEHNKRLRNAAWGFVTDSNNTQLCLLCSSRSVAAAALHAASRFCEIDIPDDTKGRPWWETQHVKLSEIRHAILYMTKNYHDFQSEGASLENASAEPSEGSQSIYANLKPPGPVNVTNGEARTAADTQNHSALGIPEVDGARSERRSSNGSVVGHKRTMSHANGHGGREDVKKQRTERPPQPATADGEDGSASHEIKHEEERERVRNGNLKSEALAQSITADGMEEGELEG